MISPFFASETDYLPSILFHVLASGICSSKYLCLELKYTLLSTYHSSWSTIQELDQGFLKYGKPSYRSNTKFIEGMTENVSLTFSNQERCFETLSIVSIRLHNNIVYYFVPTTRILIHQTILNTQKHTNTCEVLDLSI